MSRCVSVLLVLVLVARLSSAQQVNNRAELKEVEKVLEELKAERRAMSDRLQAAERELKRVRDTPKVAFAVSLGGNGVVKTTTGSMDLIYKDVLTNVGGAYSDATGEFTAPIRGVYYVRFTANAPTNFPMSAVLYKNGAEVQLIAHEQPSGEGSDTASNGAALLLQAGDKLKMMLWHNTHIWDNSNHHSTFSGFLLFPLVDEPPTEFDAEAELKALQASLKQVQTDNLGEFTAPIRGVYYVRFTANAPTNFPMSAVLYKNGAEVQLIAHEQPSGEGSDTASNGAALLLQAGDKLKMMLWHNTHIWDNSNHHSTFSGFLLFPL
uniref:C1q domain-containing protein n=1 Tax=Gasterosteus aculeatus aculeatus TaxID=481459 RepID=G3NF74_GASAC